jgi:hypothetical protein
VALQKAETHARDCDRAITDEENVLNKAKSEKGFGEFNLCLTGKRKAVERAGDAVCVVTL